MADKVDEIIELLSRHDRERGDDPSYITREYVYKLLGQANQTAEEWLDGLLEQMAYSASLTYFTNEEEERAMREMPASTLIRLYGPMDGSIDPKFEAAGVYERAKRELEAEMKAHKARKLTE